MDRPAPDTNPTAQTRPLIFLSHAGIDTAAAARLKSRIEKSEAAQAAGLKVWFDKDELRPGEDWQAQLEAAIAQSTAFAVLVGSGGVMNWVQAEVRLALNRANTDTSYRFIPILATENFAEETLPGFARRYQGIAKPEDPAQFQKLMIALLAAPAPVRLEEHPFFGLKAIDESRDYLFFGREKETADLVELVGRYSLVLVSGDSGSGKSSLVRAGLVPRFRGGALDSGSENPQNDTVYHAVITRPSADPWRQLGEAVERAANQMGLSLDDQGKLAEWARNRDDFDEVRQALRCKLDPEKVRVLLIVDQFEELLTLTPQSERARFVAFLLDLAVPPNPQFRVVLTMRHDYLNLIKGFPELSNLLDADGRKALFVLGRMTDDGLRQIVDQPLLLAGIADQDEREALANAVLHDVGQRPGDLALVQMALTETWGLRQKYDNDLLQAYSESGRVEGALAKAAETFRQGLANDTQRALLDNILVRLVRIGETRGATRRIATRDEFDDAQWDLLQKMASPEGKRLVLIGGEHESSSIEIAHEALVTAWDHYQRLLLDSGRDKFTLDALTPRAKAWADEKRSTERLATGADLETFSRLEDAHRGWLSRSELEFVETSAHVAARRRRVDRILRIAIVASVIVLSVASGALVLLNRKAKRSAVQATKNAVQAMTQEGIAKAKTKEAEKQRREAEAQRKAVQSQAGAEEALSTARRSTEDGLLEADANDLSTSQADDTLRRLLMASLVRGRIRYEDPVESAAFSRDGTRIVTVSNGKAWVSDCEALAHGQTPVWHVSESAGSRSPDLEAAADGAEILSAAFGESRKTILTGESDGTAHLWKENKCGWEIQKTFRSSPSRILHVAFFPDGRFAATGDERAFVRIWDLRNEDSPEHEHEFTGAGPLAAGSNSKGQRLLALATDKGAWLWNVDSGEEPTLFPVRLAKSVALRSDSDRDYLLTTSERTIRLWDGNQPDEPPLRTFYAPERISSAAFSAERWIVAAALRDGTVDLWQLADGSQLPSLVGHSDNVNSVAFNGDGNLIVTAGNDRTVRVWSTAPEDLTPPLTTVRTDDSIVDAAFSPNGSRFLVTSGASTQVWDPVSGEKEIEGDFETPWKSKDLLESSASLAGARFDTKGERVAAATPNGALLWSAANGENLAKLNSGSWARILLGGIRFDRNGSRLLRWNSDRRKNKYEVNLWRAPFDPQSLATTHSFESRLLGVTFATTGSIVVATETELSIWDPLDGSEWKKISSKTIDAAEVSFNCDLTAAHCITTAVAIVGGGNVQVWKLGDDGASWESRLKKPIPAAHAALSADATLLAVLFEPVGELHGGEIVSLDADEQPHPIDWKGGPSGEKRPWKMVAAAFSPHNELLATAWNNRAVTVWRANGAQAGQRVTTLKDEIVDLDDDPNAGEGMGIAFSPDDGRFLLHWDRTNAWVHRRERFAPLEELRSLVKQRVSPQRRFAFEKAAAELRKAEKRKKAEEKKEAAEKEENGSGTGGPKEAPEENGWWPFASL